MIPPHTRRLANKVNQPGGLTEAEAVKAATANLETLRDRTQQELNVMISRIREIGQALRSPQDQAALAELYALSNAVVGVAGLFGMSSLSAVAYSLCELIDRLRATRSWNGPAIRVHLDSLALMQGAGADSQEAKQIQHALGRLMARVAT